MTGVRRRALRGVATAALTLGLALGVAACSDGEDTGTTGGAAEPAGEVQRGGTYRSEAVDFAFTGGFDPTGEYTGWAWALMSNLQNRTLVTYPHVGGPEGNEIVSDLAELPEVSNGGKTFTFRLKDGIRFAPPVNREITSKDFVYALERLGTPSAGAQYAFYYNEIAGFKAFSEGKAKSISGVKTPDDRTLEITFTKPLGDVGQRMAMPATSPIPEEVAKCHTQPLQYGRYVVSSGPYMIEGSDKQDISSCEAQKPLSGYVPNRRLTFVRNPNYDPATDSPEVRENNVDRLEFTINTNLDDIYNRIEAGEVDESPDTAPPDVLRRFVRDEALQDRLRVEAGDRTWYLAFNLALPPFDDVNVRKAVNLVLDKEGIHRAWGGQTAGEIATKTVPNSLYAGRFDNADYNPYPSENNAGDVEAAKEAMRQSRYDTDKDGVCDAPACRDIFTINRNYGEWARMQPVVEQGLQQIGLRLNIRALPSDPAYAVTRKPSRKVALAMNHGWGKDYGDPSTFAVLHDGRNILEDGNSNVSFVGLTPEKAREIGLPYPEGGVPSVDADIDRCNALAGDERTDCWIAFDRKLMEEIVPWVPILDASTIYILSDRVAKYEFDQFATETAYSKVAVRQ